MYKQPEAIDDKPQWQRRGAPEAKEKGRHNYTLFALTEAKQPRSCTQREFFMKDAPALQNGYMPHEAPCIEVIQIYA